MPQQVFEFRPDHGKCNGCNYRVTSHYVIAEDRNAAEEMFAEFGDAALCGDCMVQLIQDAYVLSKDEE